MEERCLKLPFMVITLTIFTPLLADTVCNNQQVSRKDEFDNSICCYYKWCGKDHTFLPCTQHGGTDLCMKCEFGSIRLDRFSTEEFDELPCKIPECFCPREAVAVPGNDCPKTGKKQCICNRSGQFYGDDYNNCKYAPTPCNLTGIELKNNGKCGKCEKGFIKTVPDTSLCVKQSQSTEDTLSASSTTTLYTKGTEDTSTDSKSNNELTTTSEITTDRPHENKKWMATGSIIGIVVGLSVAAIAAIAIVIYCLCYRYKRRHKDRDDIHTERRHLNGYALVPTEPLQTIPLTENSHPFAENGGRGYTGVNRELNGHSLNETGTISTGFYIEHENEPVSANRRLYNHSPDFSSIIIHPSDFSSTNQTLQTNKQMESANLRSSLDEISSQKFSSCQHRSFNQSEKTSDGIVDKMHTARGKTLLADNSCMQDKNIKHNQLLSAKVKGYNQSPVKNSTTENSVQRPDGRSDEGSHKNLNTESDRKTQDGVSLPYAGKSKPIATVLPTIKSKEKANDNGLAEPHIFDSLARMLPGFGRSFSLPGNLPDVASLDPLSHDFPSMPSRGSGRNDDTNLDDANAVPMVRRSLSVPSLPSDVTSYLRADIISQTPYSSFTEVESGYSENEETGLKENH